MANTTQDTSTNHPPCMLACPILTDARGYIQLIAERKFFDALVAIRRQNPLPGVCGRICTHPCERACRRGQVDEPIAIAALKRFASDGPWKDQCQATLPGKPSRGKVAVVGSGPAGLAAAHDLAYLGHSVTIFEALPVLGGMLQVGVPEYRLPKDVVAREIQFISDLGIEMKTGVKIGKKIKLTDLFEQGFKAVLVAIGAHQSRKLCIPGEDDFEGVIPAVSFLGEVNQGKNPKVGKRVAVIGGGNTALDSARSLLRLGSELVHVVYRRSRDEMPAAQEEIEEAVHEGVQMAYLTSPLEILGNGGKVSGVKCIKNKLGEPDTNGRRSAEPVAGSEFIFDVDTVIPAIGQAPDASLFADVFALTKREKRIVVDDPYALATTHPGVFAGGDAVSGPATAIEAIAAGKQAATSIGLYLEGKSLSATQQAGGVELLKISSSVIERTKRFSRCVRISLPVNRRLRGFDEIEPVLTEEHATREALRCMHCHLGARIDREKCISCLTCVRVCPLGIPTTTKLGEAAIEPVDCQACGMCVVECPVQAIDIGINSRSDIVEEIEEGISRLEGLRPVVVGFLDLHGSFTAKDMETLRQDCPNVVPITVFGLRRIDTLDVLKAFECGANGVFLARCPPDLDPFPEVSEKVERRVTRAKVILGGLGIGNKPLEIYHMSKRGLVDKEWIEELLQKIEQTDQGHRV